MRRIVVTLLLLGAGYGTWVSLKDANAVEHTVDGVSLTVTGLGIDAHFTREGPISATYMIIGGCDGVGLRGIDVTEFVGMDLQAAAWLARQYPDFDHCNSRGAAEANKMTGRVQILSADGEVRNALRDALAKHDAAARSGGDRVCVAVTGTRLKLDTVWSLSEGKDITKDAEYYYRGRGLSDPQSPPLIYGEYAEAVECFL